jgi:hypothetical protein
MTPGDPDSFFNIWDMLKQWGAPSIATMAAIFAWRTGTAYSKLQADIKLNRTDIDSGAEEISALKSKIDRALQSHSELQVSVAALPTRQELHAGLESLRLDIRELSRTNKE